MPSHEFEPKLITVLKEGYSFKTFYKDCIAGVIVGIVALPLSIAFAIASGVKPEQGLYTAVIAGFLISLLSGSRVQIGGPTGAFIVIIFSIVQKFGYEGLALATIMAGFLLILMGIARLGDVIKYIPYPVTVGFTSGIAIIIFTSQVKEFLGLNIQTPTHFAEKWIVYFQNLPLLDTPSLALGILTIFILIVAPKITRKFPAPLIAIFATTGIVHFFNLSVATIGSRFGSVPNHFQMPTLPPLSIDLITQLSPAALAIALLAGIESLLSAVVADGMTGRKHRSNMELIGQGVANIISPLFSGLPATGAIARTATNIKSGGQTPIAGIIHALTILLLFIYLGKWAELIPMATLAGILIIIAYNMSEWRLFVKLLRSPKSDIMVLLITFFLTIFIDLIVAIEVGVVMASFLFMKRMVDVTEIKSITQFINEDVRTDLSDNPADDPHTIAARKIPKGVEIFEINGPFFFGATDKFRDTMRGIQKPPQILILRMRNVPTIDATGLRALEDTLEKAKKDGITVLLSGPNARLLRKFNNSGITQRIGENNILSEIDDALNRAREILGKE
ncbi:MAG: sulfate permease [Candidatus Omnitrophica bacterium]|nr:sulfate permease [Candidatus Omnitrophota bacterium]